MNRKKRGRPSVITAVLLERITSRLSAGEPLAVICRDDDMPSVQTIRNRMETDEAFSLAIARARQLGFDAIAADALEIVDNLTEDPASRRVRAETRLKLLSKWDPKRYGDKLDLTSGGEAVGTRPPTSTLAIQVASLLAAVDQRLKREQQALPPAPVPLLGYDGPPLDDEPLK